MLRTGLFVLLFTLPGAGFSAVLSEVEIILGEIEKQNMEVQLAKSNLNYRTEGLQISKSYLYPSLGLSGGYSRGNGISASPNTNLAGYGTGGGSVSAPDNYTQTSDGWTTSLSANYYLFTGYLVTDGIERAERDVLSSEVSFKSQIIQQKSNYLQALLEWQWLRDMHELLKRGEQAFSKIKSHKSNVQFMYSEDDDQQFDEKRTYLEYQMVRVQEALKLAEEFLLRANPGVSILQIEKLPKIKVTYEIPKKSEIQSLYIKNSFSRQNLNLQVQNAEGIKRVTDWQKPYVPNVLLTSSLGKSGTAQGTTSDNSWSAQVVLTFNLFDGYATQARDAQASVGLDVAQKTRDLETDKKILYLQHQSMKAKVNLAEYNYKKTLIRNKEIRLKDVQAKYDKGIATNFELNLAVIDLAKSKGEAWESLKNYQSAALSIASELNEWGKVHVDKEP